MSSSEDILEDLILLIEKWNKQIGPDRWEITTKTPDGVSKKSQGKWRTAFFGGKKRNVFFGTTDVYYKGMTRKEPKMHGGAPGFSLTKGGKIKDINKKVMGIYGPTIQKFETSTKLSGGLSKADYDKGMKEATAEMDAMFKQHFAAFGDLGVESMGDFAKKLNNPDTTASQKKVLHAEGKNLMRSLREKLLQRGRQNGKSYGQPGYKPFDKRMGAKFSCSGMKSGFSQYVRKQVEQWSILMEPMLEGLDFSKKNDAGRTLKFKEVPSRAKFEPFAMGGHLGRVVTRREPQPILHEMTHFAESQNKKIGQAGFHFWRSRTKGQRWESLRTMFSWPGYKNDEVCIPDKFKNPYVGKLYAFDAQFTEVATMAVQEFWDEGRMSKLAKQDPEHFAFAYAMFTGRFK